MLVANFVMELAARATSPGPSQTIKTILQAGCSESGASRQQPNGLAQMVLRGCAPGWAWQAGWIFANAGLAADLILQMEFHVFRESYASSRLAD